MVVGLGFLVFTGFFGRQITLLQAPCQQQDPACGYHSVTQAAGVHHPPVQWLLHKLAQLEGDTTDRARMQAEEKRASPYSQGPEKKPKTNQTKTKKTQTATTIKQTKSQPPKHTLQFTFAYKPIQHHCLL